MRINLSKKYKGIRSEPDMTLEEIPKLIEITLTKRMILSIVNSCYDPLGLIGCILVQPKIELRNLYGTALDWDDSIPDQQKQN